MTWPTAVDGQGWMRKTERRIGLLERRPSGGGGGGGGGGATTITVQDTSTLDLTLTGSPAVGYTLSGEVIGGAGGTQQTLVPIGAILEWPSPNLPAGYLWANGQAVSRTTYADLFAAIGTTYGVGDNSTTFNLPNKVGRVGVGVYGAAYPLGGYGGESAHTLTIAEMPSHTHTQDAHNHGQNAHAHNSPGHVHGMQPSASYHAFRWGGDGIADVYLPGPQMTAGAPPSNELAAKQGVSDYTTATAAPIDAFTATNIAATATNQYTGGNAAHNNMPPYTVVNYIINALNKTGVAGITTVAVQDTATLDLTITGDPQFGYTIKGDVLPSVRTTLAVTDTATLDLTLTGSAAAGYSLKGDVLGIPNPTTLAVVDTATLDLTLTGSSSTGYTLKGDVTGGVSGGGADGKVIPAGVTVPWSGTGAVPSGWLLADGSAVSRSVYSALFAAIGTTYGVGDNSTTFNVPNLKGRVAVGLNSADTEFNALAKTGGEKAHTLTIAELPNITGGIGLHQGASGSSMWSPTGVFKDSPSVTPHIVPPAATGGAGSLSNIWFNNGGQGAAHNNIQPYLVQNYLISTGAGGQSSGSRGVVGEIIAWSGITVPGDFLACNGQAVSRTTYSDLFQVLGTNYGVGDNSTTFNVPDLRGRVGVGVDASQTEFSQINTKGGTKTETLTVGQIPQHTHSTILYVQSVNGINGTKQIVHTRSDAIFSVTGDTIGTGPTGGMAEGAGGAAHNNLQPYISLNYLIRFRTTQGVNDTKMAVTDTATVDLTLTGDGSPVTPYTIKADLIAAVVQALVPVGSVIASAGGLAAGYLWCAGQAVSRTTYAALFAQVGTTYGVGDNSTTFNLPNLIGRVIVMQDGAQTEFASPGKAGGEKAHLLTLPESPSHAHGFDFGKGGLYGSGPAGGATWQMISATTATDSKGGDQPHNNLQPYLTMNYMIKF